MSKISLKHSGGNVVSLNSPTSAPTSADVAFKLPNADGTSGQAIVTDASGNLSFAGTGIILQVVATNVTATSSFSMSSHSTLYDTPLTVNITSVGANSKFVISGAISGEGSQPDHDYGFVIRRTIGGSGTSIAIGDAGGGNQVSITRMMSVGYNANDQSSTASSSHIAPYLDSPSQSAGTTITYSFSAIEHGGNNSTTFYINRCVDDQNATGYERPVSYITVMEVAA